MKTFEKLLHPSAPSPSVVKSAVNRAAVLLRVHPGEELEPRWSTEGAPLPCQAVRCFALTSAELDNPSAGLLASPPAANPSAAGAIVRATVRRASRRRFGGGAPIIGGAE